MKRSVSVLATGLALLAGCAELPNTRPPPDMPPAWQTAAPLADAPPVEPMDWWALFGDARLSALIEQAQRNNPDVQAAVARLAAAGDALDAARAARSPALSIFAGPIDPAASQAVKTLNADANVPLYEIGLRAQYEVDLWGRLSNGVLAAAATRDAGRYDLAAALIALRSAVAIAYFDIGQTDAQLALEAQREPLARQRAALLALKLDAGRVDAESLAAARLEVDQAVLRRVALARSRASAVDALALLVGVVPQSFSLPASPSIAQTLPPSPPAGLPAALLERRPDLRAADARLAAAEAQAAVARAERMPQIGLTAQFGLATGALSNLVDGARGFGGAGPLLDAPIFDGGRRSAAARGAAHLADAEAANYRKAALTALVEVERALRAQQDAADQIALGQGALEAIDARRARAQLQLDAGRITRFQTIELDQARFDAETAQLRALRARQDAVIGLYQALGGGWSPDAEPADLREAREAQANR